MGGSSGGIIVRQQAIVALNDPSVHGSLPHTTRLAVDPILLKEPGTWTAHDCKTVADAIHWALCNLQ